MTILADHQIAMLCGCDLGEYSHLEKEEYVYIEGANTRWGKQMISPFNPRQIKEEDGKKVISYGLSSYGYDLRCSNEFRIFTPVHNAIVDPKDFRDDCFVEKRAGEDGKIIIPPNSFALTVSKEHVRIPRNVTAIAIGKSTYARCGIIVNVTPIEAEWFGYITIEISNTTPLPAIIYANEGILQLQFFRVPKHEACTISYADRKGKYQNQTGIVNAQV